MKLLLDTHTFIWWANEPEKLSEKALVACQDDSNTLLLSVVSVWEMQIKTQLGKLKINRPIEELIKTQQKANGLQVLSMELAHVLSLSELPSRHNDPFDRLLIAQSLFKISIKGCSARQNWPKKRSIHVVCEHFEASFNAAMRPSARS